MSLQNEQRPGHVHSIPATSFAMSIVVVVVVIIIVIIGYRFLAWDIWESVLGLWMPI